VHFSRFRHRRLVADLHTIRGADFIPAITLSITQSSAASTVIENIVNLY